ncbi:MAG: hypothetical protein ACLPUO_01790 [Streptosporangiaceae bacterium]
MRAIVLLAGQRQGHGRRRVVLLEVPEQLKEILRILGWDCTPGLVIAEP